jgi:hypothetical protein
MDNVIRLFLKNRSKESNDDNNNASWCQLFIDDYNSTRVKIIHIRRGKFQIIDDAEGGKYVGKIVDASDIHHCEV